MKGATKLASVLDTVVNEATTAKHRTATEVAIVKEAAAAPRAEVAIGLRSLAAQLRQTSDTISYGDLA